MIRMLLTLLLMVVFASQVQAQVKGSREVTDFISVASTISSIHCIDQWETAIEIRRDQLEAHYANFPDWEVAPGYSVSNYDADGPPTPGLDYWYIEGNVTHTIVWVGQGIPDPFPPPPVFKDDHA